MRRAALTTLAVAGATLAIVAGSGFAIQVAALGRPGRDPLLVVRAIAHLVEFHGSTGTITIQGQQMSESCTQTWLRRSRTATVRLGDGQTLREIGTRLVETGALSVDEFELAGCPRPLTRWLASQINKGARVQVRPARVFGRRVYRLAFPTSQLKLDVYVTRRDAFPIALGIAGDGIAGISELTYGNPPVRSWLVLAHDL